MLPIWHSITPFLKDQAQAEMEMAQKSAVEELQYKELPTPHYITTMVLELMLHTEDPRGVGGIVNIFLFL